MGNFYIDESIHDNGEFIIAACVYSKIDLNDPISEIFISYGLNPTNFEYKSGARHENNVVNLSAIRNGLLAILADHCKFGLIIIPRSKRSLLGIECLKGIKQFIEHNPKLNKPLHIFFDQGFFESPKSAQGYFQALAEIDCYFHLEQNSITSKGIQIADLVAHMASIQLKHTMGISNKLVRVDDYVEPVELNFVLWASLRYSFFRQQSKLAIDDPISDFTYKVEPYGLFISNYCNENLIHNTRATFSDIYLGCIH